MSEPVPTVAEALRACLQAFDEMHGRKPAFVEDAIAMGKDALAALRLPQGTTEPCIWHEDDDGLWQMACGGDPWVFESEGAVENRVMFCMHCGKPVEVAAPLPVSGASDE